MSLNTVTLVGRAGRDPDVRYFESGSVVCKFTLAVNRRRRNSDELSEAITQYMKKVHNLVIGERTAEEIKIMVGSAYPQANDEENIMDVRGLQ